MFAVVVVLPAGAAGGVAVVVPLVGAGAGVGAGTGVGAGVAVGVGVGAGVGVVVGTDGGGVGTGAGYICAKPEQHRTAVTHMTKQRRSKANQTINKSSLAGRLEAVDLRWNSGI